VPNDAADYYRWLYACYAAGLADGRGEPPPEMSADDAAIVNIVRVDCQRCAADAFAGIRPGWLEALIEATPAIMEETL